MEIWWHCGNSCQIEVKTSWNLPNIWKKKIEIIEKDPLIITDGTIFFIFLSLSQISWYNSQPHCFFPSKFLHLLHIQSHTVTQHKHIVLLLFQTNHFSIKMNISVFAVAGIKWSHCCHCLHNHTIHCAFTFRNRNVWPLFTQYYLKWMNFQPISGHN